MKRVAPVHRYELACRLIEAVYNLDRPRDAEPRALIEELDGDMGARWLAAADVACWYIDECIKRSKGEHHEKDDGSFRGSPRAPTSNATH